MQSVQMLASFSFLVLVAGAAAATVHSSLASCKAAVAVAMAVAVAGRSTADPSESDRRFGDKLSVGRTTQDSNTSILWREGVGSGMEKEEEEEGRIGPPVASIHLPLPLAVGVCWSPQKGRSRRAKEGTRDEHAGRGLGCQRQR